MFKNILWGTFAFALAFNSHSAIDDTYLGALNTPPFNKLRSANGTYVAQETVDDRTEAQLYTSSYKATILTALANDSVTRLTGQGNANKNFLEIGTGSGIMTGNFAHAVHLESAGGDANFDGVQIHTLDDWRVRTAQTVRGGTVNISARTPFGTSPVSPDTAGEVEYRQMLSHLVQKEVAEGLPADTLLDRIRIGRKTTGINVSYGVTDDDHITNPVPSHFFTAGITGSTNNLDQVMIEMNGGNRYGTIFIDTDPPTQQEIYDVIRAAWNVVGNSGTLIIDDCGWVFDEGVGDGIVGQAVIQFLNAHQTQINSGYGGGVSFSNEANITIYNNYDGSDPDSGIRVDGASTVLTSDGQPVVEFHQIWPGRGHWIAVIRRDSPGNSTNITL